MKIIQKNSWETSRKRLIVFTRYPESGKTKTRLIPVLGEDGAAELQRNMTEHIISRVKQFKRFCSVSVEIRYEGGNEDIMSQWLGSDMCYKPQSSGDIGRRMEIAFQEAFQEGLERIVLIGTDCPEITVRIIQTAFNALINNDMVLGPANDGGYYLIGLRRETPQLFENIPWGTDKVLKKTNEIAKSIGLSTEFVNSLDDVDRPEDLPIWENSIKDKPLDETLPIISIIIPTLNEEETIAKSLTSTFKALNIERVVVDGGSQDRTIEIARSCGAKVINSPPNRAQQMNKGAEVATGDLLVFLHADTCLPEGFADAVRQILTQPRVAGGAFEFSLDVSSRCLQIIERLVNWRSRHLQMPYGDQAIFVSSALFREIGGFPDTPIMDDFEFICRLKKKGKIKISSLPVVTSARRWMKIGILKTTLINQLIIVAYYLGIPPSRIHRWAHGNNERTI